MTTKVNDRHILHAELDELIRASEARRKPNPAIAEANAKAWAWREQDILGSRARRS
jgi:hypothetical protein